MTGTGKSSFYTINREAVYSSLSSGMGATRFKNLCEQFNISCMHHKTFQNHAEELYNLTPDLRRLVFQRAVEIVRHEHLKLDFIEQDHGDILNIAVSYDGSWLTRGHTSLIGVGSVIDVLTGLVLDTHVMSTFCHVCGSKQRWKEEDPRAHRIWEMEHIGSGKCSSNFYGTSGMMEVHAGKILWLRSVKQNRLRYTVMVSDGDSKLYDQLRLLQPYGKDHRVFKEECINHVGKRLGTALRNLTSDCSKRGITLGGKGYGRLTQMAIGKLQVYFTRAIRSHATAAEMKRAIMATLDHCFSTDEKPQHDSCPLGEKSWCFYQRNISVALARHNLPEVRSHKKFVHTPLDEDLLRPHLMPIYERLTADDLLKRCERKATQNANESLHSVMWSKCDKVSFYSKPRVEFTTILAIMEFNFGPSFAVEVKSFLNLPDSLPAEKLRSYRAKKRIFNSQICAQDADKGRREKIRVAKAKYQQDLEAEEGGPSYGPGIASVAGKATGKRSKTQKPPSAAKAPCKKGVAKPRKSGKLPKAANAPNKSHNPDPSSSSSSSSPSYSSSSSPSSSSNSNLNPKTKPNPKSKAKKAVNKDLNPNPNCNLNPKANPMPNSNPKSKTKTNPDSNLNPKSKSKLKPNPTPNPNPISNPNSNPNLNPMLPNPNPNPVPKLEPIVFIRAEKVFEFFDLS